MAVNGSVSDESAHAHQKHTGEHAIQIMREAMAYLRDDVKYLLIEKHRRMAWNKQRYRHLAYMHMMLIMAGEMRNAINACSNVTRVCRVGPKMSISCNAYGHGGIRTSHLEDDDDGGEGGSLIRYGAIMPAKFIQHLLQQDNTKCLDKSWLKHFAWSINLRRKYKIGDAAWCLWYLF